MADFIRFFKKKEGETPEQYNDRLVRSLNALASRVQGDVSSGIEGLETRVDTLEDDTGLLNTVVDLTSAVADYALSVNETAKITITAASTNLHISVTNGVYEINAIFDDTTFGANQTISLNPNNTTYVGEVKVIRMIGDTSIATDEYDTATADVDAHAFSGGAISPRHFHSKLIISGMISDMHTNLTGTTGGTRRMISASSVWAGSAAHTLLGTLSIGEVASGTLYVTRIA